MDLAAKTIEEAQIEMPVLVDEIDNPLWCSYGRLPNNAFLIGQDGLVEYYQKWNDAAEMEVAIQSYFLEH